MSNEINRRALLQAAGLAAPLLAARAASAATTPRAVKLPKPVKVCIVGLHGHWSEVTTAQRLLPEIEIAAVSTTSDVELRKAENSRALANAKRYTNYEQMLDREKPDAVCVCDENGARAETVIASLRRKIPTAAEKPMGISIAELNRVKRAAAETKTPLTMLLPMRFSPTYLVMKQIVDAGEIGEAIQLSGQKSYQLGPRPEWMKHRQRFGGAIPYIGCHLIDLLRFISGRDMVETAAFHSNIGHPEVGDMEDNASVVYRLDNGGTGGIRLDYLRPAAGPSHGDDRVRIAGSKGIVEHQGESVTLITDKKAPHEVTERPEHPPLFADFLDSVFNGTKHMLPLEDIFRVTEIVLRSCEAADQGRLVKI